MPNPSVSLRFFGGIAVERDGKRLGGRATQRRRLGVLTLLAAAPSGQLSRDKLLGYLWPEAETEAGRHLLAGAVYELRKALGEVAILSRGDDLALNPEVVTSDAGGFEAALSDGASAQAVALYRGPFADGFFVSQAPEFERWLEETRARYLGGYRTALKTLGHDREQAGALAEAADAWQRLAALDPSDASVVLRTMQVLLQSRQPAAAIRQSQLHRTHVRREFGAEPDVRVSALAEDIRREQRAALPAAPSDAAGPATPDAGSIPAGTRRGVTGAILAVAALVVLAIGWNMGADRADGGAPDSIGMTITVRPFRVVGTPGAGWSEDFATLLARALDGAGGIRARRTDAAGGPGRSGEVVRPAAAWAASDPAPYIQGEVERLSGEVRVRAGLFGGASNAPLAEADVTGDPSRLSEAVDLLALELLAAWPRPPAMGLSRAAARNTRSLSALKAWLAGEREFRAGHFLAASEAFARAVRTDSTFALGHYRLSQARLAADFPEAEVARSDSLALRFSAALPEQYRLLLHAYAGFRQGNAEYAEQRYQGLTTRYPDDLESWLQLGETRFHYGPSRGLPLQAAGDAFRRAAALDPGNWSAIWHLSHLAAIAGRRDELVSALDRLLALAPERSQELELRGLRALALNDRRAEPEVTRQLLDADELLLFQLTWRAAVFLQDFDGAERIARILVQPDRPTYSQMLGRLSLVHLDLARGQHQAAGMEHQRVIPLRGVEGYLLFSQVSALLLPYASTTPDQVRTLQDSLASALQSVGPNSPTLLILSGLLYSAVGARDAALARASELDQLDPKGSGWLVRADVEYRRGRYQQALEYLGRQGMSGWYGYRLGSLGGVNGHGRYLRAESLFHLGRGEEALGWYGSLGENALGDLGYLGPALLRRGQILRQTGRPAEAEAEFRRLAALWRTADPALKALADSSVRY